MTDTTSTAALDPETLDIISNEVYRNGPPHELYTRLRREAPIIRHRGIEPGFPEWFWAISRHADVVTVSRQFQRYSSARKGSLMNEDRPDLEVARMMIDTDPPEHTRLRMLVNRGFTPKAMRLLEDHYREVAQRLVADALEAGTLEFVEAVSSELPLIAIAELLGIPAEDRRKVFEWSNRMIGSTDPDYSGGIDDATNAAAELYMYANALAADRAVHPREDIITMLLGEHDGDKLSEHEFDLFVLLLSVAGNETTRNGISHGVLALIEHPEALAAMRSERGLLESGVEEMLRWGTPVNNFRRTATCDVELHGVQIREGDAVVMLYASANRDEDVFPDPFRFDVSRNPNPHVTFGGGGPHFCLGSNLARLEMRILFEELLARVGSIELTGEVTRLRSNFVHGIKQLPVRLTAG
ncbi:MAG: cytochrome P450 [Acidimicrobiia bacterium]